MSDQDPGWLPLPTRARSLFMLTHGLGLAIPALVLLVVVATQPALLDRVPGPFAGRGLVPLLLPALGLWLAVRRHRHTHWLLDDTGFGYRRGRVWRVETRVPRTRVQHVDLTRGPLARHFGLAPLVVHTAGTRASSVTVPGLDADEARRLRDVLARQVDDDDDDDDPRPAA